MRLTDLIAKLFVPKSLWFLIYFESCPLLLFISCLDFSPMGMPRKPCVSLPHVYAPLFISIHLYCTCHSGKFSQKQNFWSCGGTSGVQPGIPALLPGCPVPGPALPGVVPGHPVYGPACRVICRPAFLGQG